MSRENWVWMPHAAHLIIGEECRFRLATWVNGYIVSTVGEWWPDSTVRRIFASEDHEMLALKGDNFDHAYRKKYGFKEVGCERLYETTVFRAQKSNLGCCEFTQIPGTVLDSDCYNDSKDATEGHYKLCEKWDLVTEIPMDTEWDDDLKKQISKILYENDYCLKDGKLQKWKYP